MALWSALAAQRHLNYDATSTISPKRAYNDGQEVEEPERVITRQEPRLIGISSGVFMIVNRMIGAGIFVTPSMILAQCGSVGLSLSMWILGAAFAVSGIQVYVLWGTAIPRNGAEKNYLEHLFPRPTGLTTAVYAAYATLMGFTAGNCVVFAQYLFKALSIPSSSPSSSSETSHSTPLKFTAFGCITFTMLVHGLFPSFGIKLQNMLGMLKIFVLAIVIGSGIIAFIRGPFDAGSKPPHHGILPNKNFENIWAGTTNSPAEFCLALYSTVWGYGGYQQINYALSEVKSPKRTLRIAGPLAVGLVSILYISANLAYLVAVPKEEIIGGEGRALVAALLFRNVYGPGRVERLLDAFVATSAMGNVVSVMYGQGLVIQQLALEGVLPASNFWASKHPAGAPLAGFALHWLACTLVIFGLSAKDTFSFVLNVRSYPEALLHVLISFGPIYLSSQRFKRTSTSTPLNTLFPKLSATAILSSILFGLANLFLVVVPFIPPPPGREPYKTLPYWSHIVGGWMVLGVGVVWWRVWKG